MDPSRSSRVPKNKLSAPEPLGQITPSEPPASTNTCQDDAAHKSQRKHIEDYISQLRQKLLDDFVKTFLPKLLDDFEKTFLQRTNSSDPTACLEECRMTCVAALVLKAVPQHVNEHYEWRLTSGKLPIFKELENEALTPTFEDQSMTDGRTHSPHENSVRTTNDAKEATSKAPPDTRDSSRISLPLGGATVDLPGPSLS
ncbi:uncharacterized protein LOC119349375 [Triticum dicoccoides]|uniref:uncharacterized protein LOC119349375 n=1 Tax=Triticum dicoccoides TaxID=85692 RepID=UPI0001BA923F|nr:uncharacterized protein LOC119349375 [Triticum dicoccoides]XP_044451911.1 uncharacterized protein LOC123183210 [Triticum aestivum]